MEGRGVGGEGGFVSDRVRTEQAGAKSRGVTANSLQVASFFVTSYW